MKHERHYLNDILNGPWKTWHTNGQLKNDAFFENGEKCKYDVWFSFEGEEMARMCYNEIGRTGTEICSMVDENTYELERGIASFDKGEFVGFAPFIKMPRGYDE